ncbi:MAG: hypothetical protein H0X27_05180 [Caulobacteraceae bacterium]|nr:hypothetical protein [Caulobacteraceae bacterium]
MTSPHSLRLALVAASAPALALLSACNVVITPAPLLTRADEAGAPAPRPGLWRFDGDADCRVDESRPLIEWPKCGAGAVLNAGTAGYFERGTGVPVWTTQPLILAAGAPRIAQAQVKFSGDVKVEGATYAYAGVRATKLDDRGRVVALSAWPVQCGPPPLAGEGGGAAAGTAKPLPGLTMKRGDPVCSTTSKSALREAAKASEAWAPNSLNAHWVRNGP